MKERIFKQNGKYVVGPELSRSGSFLVDGFIVLAFEVKHLILDVLGLKSKAVKEFEESINQDKCVENEDNAVD